ncbi:hypothetical protein GCM10027277_38660 [Pseudoduganella ginsengisoli]|uniref:Uncharacterized protein n=1 Tax=Pseudoduganella ginsengisoli TaxID=1462440 RepID=A0A6L6PZ83_9BURK|nr:hypothetical protein [Pseudoduganella ginsengisoli]MTW02062.1 hypothetical protein [Pseudoduganella ginsengisoli]
MADPIAAAHLFQTLAQLAYIEAKLSSQPQLPFHPADAPKLAQQSNHIGDCAAKFRLRDPALMNNLSAAQAAVDKALAELNAILHFVPTRLTTEVVYADIDSAIQAVNSV